MDKRFLRPVKTYYFNAKGRARIKAMQQSKRKSEREQADNFLKEAGVASADAHVTIHVKYWDNCAQLRRHLQKTFETVELCD